MRSSFSASDDHAQVQVPALDDAEAAAEGHQHQARLHLATLHDENLVISGDFVEVLWFQGFTEYLQPGK